MSGEPSHGGAGGASPDVADRRLAGFQSIDIEDFKDRQRRAIAGCAHSGNRSGATKDAASGGACNHIG